MEERRRRALRRSRVLLVEGLRLEPLWAPLRDRGVFTAAMVEELQVGGWRRGVNSCQRGGRGLRGAPPSGGLAVP